MSRYRTTTGAPTGPGRWQLVRDIISLQIKLLIDGFRDFLLVPVSLVTGAISLFKPGKGAGTAFYSLLKLGRKSDHWIDLFSAADRLQPGNSEQPGNNAAVDDMISRLEAFVIREYQNGDVTRQAKEHFEQFLGTLNRQKKSGNKDEPLN